MKKKKFGWGGARPGAGAKETGVNNVHIGMSVPKKYADFLKAMVKSKIAELRASENQSGFAAAVKPIPKKTINKLNNVLKEMRQKSGNNKPNTDYLQKRRNAKLNLKP